MRERKKVSISYVEVFNVKQKENGKRMATFKLDPSANQAGYVFIDKSLEIEKGDVMGICDGRIVEVYPWDEFRDTKSLPFTREEDIF